MHNASITMDWLSPGTGQHQHRANKWAGLMKNCLDALQWSARRADFVGRQDTANDVKDTGKGIPKSNWKRVSSNPDSRPKLVAGSLRAVVSGGASSKSTTR